MDAVQYSINLIVKRTGETLEEFRENKSSDCDVYPGVMSEEYKVRVKEGAVSVKAKKCQNLFQCAVAFDISLFDLMDSLVKELEIETKILSLQPVDAAQLNLPLASPMQRMSSSMSSASSTTSSTGGLLGGMTTSADDDILSDIDEVIRQDTSRDGGAPPNITITICTVCKKMFHDEDLFTEHEEAGCIDY